VCHPGRAPGGSPHDHWCEDALTAAVLRYAHLSPDHIRAAVEKLAQGDPGSATGTKTGTAQ
jgi:hypothetical protein